MDADKMSGDKKRLVPKLRFPEFRDMPRWSESYIRSLCSSISSGKDSNDPEGVFNLYGSTGIIGKTAHASYEGYYLLVARVGANAGLLTMACGSFGVTDNTLVINLKDPEKIDFVYYLLDQIGLNKLVFGSGQPLITGKLLKGLKVFLPIQEEQQKIANCLASIDAVIAAQGRKVELLVRHKKVLLQQLFPREGETTPRLRFPEFRKTGEWEIVKAKLLFTNRVEPGEDGLPIYSVTMNDGLTKRDSLDRKIDDIPNSSGNKSARKHDIIYNMMRMWQGASGVAIEDCMVSPAYVVLAPREDVCTDFYGYLLKLPQFLQILSAHSQGLTKDRLRLYFKDFANIKFPKPSVVEEQQKIANCLSSIDTLIDLHRRRLAALKQHKKGLMQQLFPSLDEVQG